MVRLAEVLLVGLFVFLTVVYALAAYANFTGAVEGIG
jgi:hypothetical protein